MGEFTIEDWQPRPYEPPPPRDPWTPWRMRSVVLLLALLLHLGVGALMLSGGDALPPTPPKAWMTAGRLDDSEFVTELVFIDLSAPESPERTVTDRLPPAPKIDLRALVAVPPSWPQDPEATPIDPGLFMRYVAQVEARIERAWDRPPAATAASFQCVLQVSQDGDGRVTEVEVTDRCGSDAAQRQSLVTAVFRASPLPGLPEGLVRDARLTLQF